MAKHIKLAAATREKAGKGVSRALRRENRIPAVIYGDHKEPVLISLPAKEVNLEYRKGHMHTSLSDIDVGGKNVMCLARDIQLDPVKDFVLHIDFLRVTPKTRIEVSVPVHFLNEENSPGLRDGGVLNVVRHEIELLCPATEIPESIEVDIGALNQGDALNSDSIKLPAGVEFVIQDRAFTIVTLAAPRKMVEEEAPAAEGAEGEAGAEAGEQAAEEKE